MAESQGFFKSHEFDTSLEEILKNIKLIKGPTTKYILDTTTISEEELLRKERIGEKDDKKPNKVILLVGETGSGKSTLISAMVNYIMGVRWEHQIWLEVVETSEDQTESQTKAVTVYEVFAQDSPFSLTIIDTPGFGDTKGADKDKVIAEALQKLFRSKTGIHEMHAVCLVLKATDARLHDRQLYILDEILSLFGKDIEKHISILITCADATVPKKALNLIKKCNIPCAKKDDQPVYFKFNNCQSECYDEKDRSSYKSSWDHGNENFRRFFDYVNVLNPINVNMTEGVLRSRKQLNASVNNLKNRIEWAEGKKTELQQTEAAVKEYEKDGGKQKNYQFEVDEVYKVLVKIESSWWHLSKHAMRCPQCEENCHYPGCWWVSNLSKCSVMSTAGKCTVCTFKCDHTKHVKDNQIYEIRTRRVKRTNEGLKQKYEEYIKKKTLMSKLENEIKQTDAEKIRLVEECYQCLEKLMETALKSTTMSCFIHLDFMINKIKETGNQERVQKLEELKRRALEENTGLIKCAFNFVNNLSTI